MTISTLTPWTRKQGEKRDSMPNGGSDCCGTCWFNAKNILSEIVIELTERKDC